MVQYLKLSLLFLLFYSCQSNKRKIDIIEGVYTNPLKSKGSEPWAIFHKGVYYYTEGCEDRIILWKTKDLTRLEEAESKEIWLPKDKSNSCHLWAPEIHFIGEKWYIYFTADDGNTDNHQIYVIENNMNDPFEGEFVLKENVQTDNEKNWAIHASVFENKGKLYMIWSGWKKRRVETEIQCIYIALMENPWTLSSERILISEPDFEWERQWVNPDGSKTAYPIYVNEAPHAFLSKNRDKILIYYSASGNWTPYYATGLLMAPSDSDLLNPKSWTKCSSPQFVQDPENKIYSPGNVCFIPSPDGKETYILYHARTVMNEAPGAIDSRNPRMQKIDWDNQGIPILGKPVKVGEELKKPSGS